MASPVNKWRENGITIAKWAGREPGQFQFSIQKSYKDKTTGDYKESKVFFERDLSVLKKLIQQALSEIEHAPEEQAPTDDTW